MRFPPKTTHDYDGIRLLVTAAHRAALGDAKVIVDHIARDAPGYMMRRSPQDNGHYYTEVGILAVEPMQPHVRRRVVANQREEEMLAKIQVERVFRNHEIMHLDTESLAWAEELMLRSTAHFESIGKIRR